jgi:Spy/CpxP family protein refolding chaperone
MTNPYKATLAFCGAALLGLALPAMAQPGPHGHGGPGGPGGPQMIERMTQQLNLTDDQVTQLRAIVSKYHQGASGDAMKAFHDARANLETLISDPASTDQQVMTAAKDVSAKGEQAAVQRHRMAVEIDSILTPDQRQKAKDLKAQGWGHQGRFQPPAPEDAPEGD